MGNVEWSKMYPAIYGWSYLLSLAKTQDKGIVLSNGYIVKTDTVGNSCSSIDTVVTQQTWTAVPFSFTAVPLGPIQIDTNIVIPGTTNDSIIDICNLMSVVEKDNSNEMTISLFPNPATQFLTIEINKLSQITYLEIFDQLGRVLISKRLNILSNQISMDVSQMPEGLYFITASDKAGKCLSSKICIAR
jgi:hypothetical protein